MMKEATWVVIALCYDLHGLLSRTDISHIKQSATIMEEKLPFHDNVPHRASGYPELAFLISTDMDFSIFRKFDELSARNLLRMQAELITIEEELRSIDNSNTHNEHIMDIARKESLFSRLEILLGRYRTFILC
jgi:hypothetical protein